MEYSDLKRPTNAFITSIIIAMSMLFRNGIATEDLSAYQVAFFQTPDDSSKFNHFAIHEQTGDIYIGATNNVHHLYSTFALENSVSTTSQCATIGGRCINHNKVLVIDYEAQKVITCGSENEGRCQLRNLADISILLENSNSVAASASLSTEAIIAKGPFGQNMLYVAATYDPKRYGIGSVTPIARRSIRSYGDALLAPDAEIFFTPAAIYNKPFMISYMGVFNWKQHVHFVTIQKQDYDPFPFISSSGYISKLNRVCQGSKDFNSYTEIILQCRGTHERPYNLVQSVHVGTAGSLLAESLNITEEESILYGVFAHSKQPDSYDPTNSSAICVFKMVDIETAFSEAVHGCLRNGSDFGLDYVKGSNCPAFPAITSSISSMWECDAFCYSYAKSTKPLVSDAVFEHPVTLMSSINVTTERNHTIAFVGTPSGELMKIQIDDKTHCRLYETLHVGSPVLRHIEFDESREHVFVLTEEKFMKLRTSNCSYYLTSEECIGVNGEEDGDPYCGWCTEQIRCTRYHECTVSSGAAPWLPYSQQCMEIMDVQPSRSLPVSATEQTITLTVDLETDQYESYKFYCSFDDRFESDATKLDNRLTCRTPPKSDIPPIISNDSITIPLYIRSIPALVGCVKTEFSFYDCSLHESCTSCVSSVWGCDWCVVQHTCTHKSAGCQGAYSVVSNVHKSGATNVGTSYCPQLMKQTGEVLLPNGATRDIAIPVKNLPMEHEVDKWECILAIDGDEVIAPAVRQDSEIICQSRTYTYDAYSQEVNVTVSVKWNNDNKLDDIHGFTVTLFKCEVNRPDCSRCLSIETTRRELTCGWCPQYGVCIIGEDILCQGDWISPTSGSNCPNPNIQEVWPTSGPVEGKTIVNITGTNLGRSFSDVHSITIGGWLCDLEGLEEFYITGESVSCRVREAYSPSKMYIMANVWGANSNLQISNSDVIFNYHIPEIIDFYPKVGPQAGGTEIKIRGEYLNTGRLITASIGEANCLIDRSNINDSFAVCRTSESLSGSSYSLIMTFDGVATRSSDSFTYQLNPTVLEVNPKTSIQHGGRKLLVRGDRLDTIQRPMMFVVLSTGELSKDICSVHNASYMECPTPTIYKTTLQRRKRNTNDQLESILTSLDDLVDLFVDSNNGGFTRSDDASTTQDTDSRLPIGFIMDGVTDLLRWSDISQVTIKYYPDPEYETFDNGKSTLSGTVLQLKGKNLNLASTREDVEVLIGSEECQVTVLAVDSLTCTAPEKRPFGYDEQGKPHDDILPRLTVRHGNYVIDIGELDYAKTTLPTWVQVFLGILFPLLLLVLIIVLIGVAYWYRKTRSQYEMVHNREEELLEQIRSLRNALTLQGDHRGRPTSHVTLSNNVRIDKKDVSVSYEQLLFQHELGQGAFGKVFQAILEYPDEKFTRKVAVKTVKDTTDPGTTLKFLEEGLLMKNFIHPNIMGLIGLAFDLKDNPVIVLPLMPFGDLRTYLRRESTVVNGRQLVTFALDVAYGMIYLADRKFVHRDLAARNCMVSENLVVKVSDFGLSRDVHGSEIYEMKDTHKLPVKWMAIENLDRKIFTSQSDVWSYGVLFWEIFTRGDSPYSQIDNKDVYYHLMDGKRLECPEYCPQQVYDLMFKCWMEDPEDRPTFPDLVSRLTCILDSNDPGDVTDLAQDQDAPGEEEPLLHVNPTYLEPMDMFPVMPPPAIPTYANDHDDDDYENDSETQI